MRRFPLLKLPSLVLESILKSLDIKDLIDLSMMSSKFKRTLENFKLPINDFDLNIGAFYTWVEFRYEGWQKNGENFKRIIIKSSYPIESYGMNGWKVRRLNGEDVMCLESRNGSERVLKAKNNTIEARVELLEQICTHLLSFMTVKYSRFYCEQGVNLSNFFWISNFTKNLDSVQIEPLIVRQIEMTPEDLYFVLEKVTTTSRLYLKTACPGVKYSKPFDFFAVHIGNSSWVDFKNLKIHPKNVEMEFEVDGEEVAESDVNRLIKEWVDKKYSCLKKLKFVWNERSSYEKINVEKILDGLEAVTNDGSDQVARRQAHRSAEICGVIQNKAEITMGAITRVEKFREITFVTWFD